MVVLSRGEEDAVASAVSWILFPEDASGGEIPVDDLMSAWLKLVRAQARRRNLPPPINGRLRLDERLGH